MSEPEELKVVTKIFKQCSRIKGEAMARTVKSLSLGSPIEIERPSSIVDAANKLVKSLSEQLIVYYCALSETISSKQ
jgi:hypothetical protein